MNGLDIEGVLAAHLIHAGSGNGRWNAECLAAGCSWAEHGCGGFLGAHEAHNAHVGAVIRTQIAAWLSSEATVEIAARASYEHPGMEGASRWSWDDKRVWNETRECWRSDTTAALSALAAEIQP